MPVYNVVDYGAKSNSPTPAVRRSPGSDATGIQTALYAAAEAGGGIVYVPVGTYIIDQTLNIPSKVTLQGEGAQSILKAKVGLDAPVLLDLDATNVDITIRDLKIDGNKANQTVGAGAPGIKMGNVDNLLISNVWVHATMGHAIWALTTIDIEAGVRMENCIVTESGGAGSEGVEGSSFIVGGNAGFNTNATLINCQAYDSAKAAYRISGGRVHLVNCIGVRSGNAAVQTDSSLRDLTITGCEFSDSTDDQPENDGIRLVGVQRFSITGNTIRGNGGSGIIAINSTKHGVIANNVISNNGINADALDLGLSKSGIAIKNDAGSGNPCEDILISGNRCYDDQGTPTQEYGIDIRGNTDFVTIMGNDLRGNEIAPIYNDSSAGTMIRVDRTNLGHPLNVVDVATANVTGTTAETSLKTITVPARTMGRRGGFRVRAGGTITGTVGTKTVRFVFGAYSKNISSQAAGGTANWVCEADVYNLSTGSQRTLFKGFESTPGFETIEAGATGQDSTTALDLKITGQLGDGADTISMTFFSVEPL